MNEFEVWVEGYQVTGNASDATCHGFFPGETFEDAVECWANSLDAPSRSLVDLERMTFWGCRIFDNEVDARRSFG